ncbi:MAG TPA: DUF4180 domain-containing protein [Pseudonocardiaceae bacterium]|jgi:hypothetical protein|nr:DUF4180 domain-containing protein [Pseudonocardiaceae bacterium]
MNAVDTVETRHGIRVMLCADDGPTLTTEQDAVDLIAESVSHQAALVVLPVARLDHRFFDLSSGIAGQVVQKFVQYRRRLALIGDISAYVDASGPLRDYVRETNHGREVWFVRDLTELDERLRPSRPHS